MPPEPLVHRSFTTSPPTEYILMENSERVFIGTKKSGQTFKQASTDLGYGEWVMNLQTPGNELRLFQEYLAQLRTREVEVSGVGGVLLREDGEGGEDGEDVDDVDDPINSQRPEPKEHERKRKREREQEREQEQERRDDSLPSSSVPRFISARLFDAIVRNSSRLQTAAKEAAALVQELEAATVSEW